MNDNELKKENTDEPFEDVTFVESTEDGDALPTKDIVKKLRDELKKTRTEKEEYLTGWQRAKADYVNLQKEMTELRRSTTLSTKEQMVENVLPTLDSFDMAFANRDVWEKVDANWRTGVEYIHQQLLSALADSGVEKIDQVNVAFNPLLHESIQTVATDDATKDHTVAQILQVGYKIGERVIRPARIHLFELKK